jgi:hypothetical protein
MSIILVTLGAPLMAARRPDPARAARGLFVFFAVFCVAYALYVSFLHPTSVPHRW